MPKNKKWKPTFSPPEIRPEWKPTFSPPEWKPTFSPPRRPDYSKCCIYKIEHIDNERLLYVGHTTNFIGRESTHKTVCNNEKNKHHNLKIYQIIRENGGWDMFKMIEVEKYPCENRREAEKKENEIMIKMNANMNTNSAYR